jgi:integrase
MEWKDPYTRAKEKLLSNEEVCKENRNLFRRFFEYEEYKLKRKNGLSSLDNNSYKTLLAYVSRLNVVNRWLKNKAWVKLTKTDIKKLYDDLEDGKITTKKGKPVKDKKTYYKLIIRSKPFEMAGKLEMVKEVMEFYASGRKEEVRFIAEETFRKIVNAAIQQEHKAFLWLCWDLGENGSSILKLTKRDCIRQINKDSKEPEYYVNFRREILKRSRRPRTEVTNYNETVEFLDALLEGKKEDDLLFNFEHRWAEKILKRAAGITNAKCIPAGQEVTLKDLRSSMACDLLSKGWTTDEVNSRLGHTPSSREIDKYVNFLAIDRNKPKKKIFDTQMSRVMAELEEAKNRERVYQRREKSMEERIALLEEHLTKREQADVYINRLLKNKKVQKIMETEE